MLERGGGLQLKQEEGLKRQLNQEKEGLRQQLKQLNMQSAGGEGSVSKCEQN